MRRAFDAAPKMPDGRHGYVRRLDPATVVATPPRSIDPTVRKRSKAPAQR
jgi:hypothetical protein